jgi:CelD/BcsL family acetyltransferase involved in cellulose biosynthesis
MAKARLIEDLIASGVTRLDLGPELYEWKRVWADDMQWHTGLLIFNRTTCGYAVGAAKWLGQRARYRRDRDLHFCNPREVRAPDE